MTRATLARRVRELGSPLPAGAISAVDAQGVEVRGLRLAVGDALRVGADGREAEVLAVGATGARAAVYGRTDGLARGDAVTLIGEPPSLVVPDRPGGQVLDGLGRPVDGVRVTDGTRVGLAATTPPPLARRRLREPLDVGVRVLDTLTTVARGQRIGVFAGSGVGKSTLLGMLARGTTADVVVVGLVGERGREVRELLEDDLGPEGRARSVVVVATSDDPPMVRIRAAQTATRIAEHHADRGADVLLLLDSLTRVAMAHRDVALAAGELPTARGYPPSTLSTLLPTLLERVGPREHGTVTAIYTVLVEGDDLNDPVADTARSILDGHVVLDRRLALAGRYPPVDPLASLSRSAAKVVSADRLDLAARLRRLLAAAEEVRDLVEVGAYVPGTNRTADAALALRGEIEELLRQRPDEVVTSDVAWERLAALLARADALEATS